ncbi:MAG: HlyU family transcriptional regulator [Pseudomonadota bacterium]
MSFLSKLFGGSPSQPEPKAETYEGFTITPAPQRDGSSWRIAARIEKDGKTHDMIRADTLASQDDATMASTAKAKQLIDEQGPHLFG